MLYKYLYITFVCICNKSDNNEIQMMTSVVEWFVHRFSYCRHLESSMFDPRPDQRRKQLSGSVSLGSATYVILSNIKH